MIDKLLYFIAEQLIKIKNSTPKLERVGDVYWGVSSWEAEADGFINMQVSGRSDANYQLVYVEDANSQHIVGVVCGIGKGAMAQTTFPVQKGHRYRTSYAYGQGEIMRAYYYKFGGY